MNMPRETAWVVLACACLATGCPRIARQPARPTAELTTPAPAEAEVPPVDVDALLEREGLLNEPDEDMCCGEGRITLERALWVELDGQEPPELVLELMEYIGEGGASWHYHAFDVRDVLRPARIEPTLTDGGYMYYSYMEVTDLDADGVDELMLVSEIRDAAPLGIYVMREGRLELATTATEQAQVYLPFDHDGDGRQELIGLKSQDLEGTSPVEVIVLQAPSGLLHPAPRDPREWLPQAATATLTRARLPHAEPTLALLTKAMSDRGLSPSDPDAVIDAALTRLEAEELGIDTDAYVRATSGTAAPSQLERISALMSVDGAPRSTLAARLWLRTSPKDQRHRALDWAERTLDWWVRTAHDDLYLRLDEVVAELTPQERDRVCAQTGALLRDPDVTPERLGRMVWSLWTTTRCVREVVDALEHQEEFTRQVVRGAIHAYSWGKDATPEVTARYAALEPELIAALTQLLEDQDATLRAEAALALGGLPGTTQTLRDALAAELEAGAKRAILLALAEADDPGNPALFLRLLNEPQSDEVTRMLHAELARSGDLGVLKRGLALARSSNAYSAYEWRLVYHDEVLTEPIREQIARDAFSRLTDPQPRVRQSACAILEKKPHLKGDPDALERAAHEDDTPWVRTQCAAALKVMWSTIGPM